MDYGGVMRSGQVSDILCLDEVAITFPLRLHRLELDRCRAPEECLAEREVERSLLLVLAEHGYDEKLSELSLELATLPCLIH